MKNYRLVIGLEIHAQLHTKSKMFSSSSANGDGLPNEHANYYDLGIPGNLPRFNRECVNLAIKSGIALNCEIQQHSSFDRKHYFYPDSPLGYQITQFYNPICIEGSLMLKNNKKIKINRIHMEADAGKMLHEGDKTLLDYNRSGVGLIEIVTYPDFDSGEDVAEFVKELILILKYAKVCECNLENGNLRVDVNISVTDSEILGTRVEIKNINSTKFIMEAIEYEKNRQIALLNDGKKVVQETRGYDSDRKITYSMREKEDAHSYRYIPDYNLMPINLTSEEIENIRNNMEESPSEKRKRLGFLKDDIIEILVNDDDLSEYFESVQCSNDEKAIFSNLLVTDLMGMLKKENIHIKDTKITANHLLSLANMLYNNHISSKIAKQVLGEIFITGEDPIDIIETRGLRQISDPNIIQDLINKTMSKFTNEIERYKNGDTKLFMMFVGAVIKTSENKANPEIVKSLLEKLLS